jgi:hypothetical protein
MMSKNIFDSIKADNNLPNIKLSEVIDYYFGNQNDLIPLSLSVKGVVRQRED